MGRIYRVTHETTRRDNATSLAGPSPVQLAGALSHPNGWWRETAQRLIVERGGKSAVPALVKLAEAATDWRTRLHALWTLDGIDGIERSTVTKALEDTSRDVRAAAIRVAERWLGEAGDPIQAAVLSGSTTPIGPCGSSWRPRSARCLEGLEKPLSSRCSNGMGTIRS